MYNISYKATANMDKMPVPYTLKITHTLAWCSAKFVAARRLSCKVKVTAALTVTKAEKLIPFMIFTGRQTAQAVHYNKMKTNWKLYPQTEILCTVSPKEGMDSKFMLEWIKRVWKPFTLTFPDSFTYLILDRCPCHKTEAVLDAFALLGTIVDFIPAGYMPVAQPIDIGINALFKKNYIRYYTDWF